MTKLYYFLQKPFKKLIGYAQDKRSWLLDASQKPPRWIQLGRPLVIAAVLLAYINWDLAQNVLLIAIPILGLPLAAFYFLRKRRDLRKVGPFIDWTKPV